MLEIVNCSFPQFEEDAKGKKVYLFGGGKAGQMCLQTVCENLEVEAIVDNDRNKWGKTIAHKHKEVPVISVKLFQEEVSQYGISDIILLISTIYTAWEIVEELEKVDELSGLKTYLLFLLRYYPQKFEKITFTGGERRIPKIIHYCWFGKKEIPEHLQKYIETWRTKCPDYEIVRWDESTYDVSKNKYMKEAYDSGMWGFVPDYARLDIIYGHGGIYLDTDVEVYRSLDVLLCDGAFLGASGIDEIGLGLCFGAIKGHPFIEQLRDYYDDKSFYLREGSVNTTPCTAYTNPVLQRYGIRIRNEYQKIGDIVIYPSDVFAPEASYGMGKNYSENTLSIHHCESSWKNDEEKKKIREMKLKLVKRGALDSQKVDMSW